MVLFAQLSHCLGFIPSHSHWVVYYIKVKWIAKQNLFYSPYPQPYMYFLMNMQYFFEYIHIPKSSRIFFKNYFLRCTYCKSVGVTLIALFPHPLDSTFKKYLP